jgi:NAD(P)-dependent dehydrogenase (short-subunit alcohol dehydrogenase family)
LLLFFQILKKLVFIIGASRGIGLELAQQYAQAGHRVVATARDEGGLARLRDCGAEAFALDVAQPASVSGLAWRLDGEKIDIALYVAGVIDRASADSPPTQQTFDHLMHTNVLGAMQAIPQVAPLVEAASTSARMGRFVFVTSQMGRIGAAASGSWLYRVSKAALNMAVASAQTQYPRAILAAMHPGWVQTDMGGSGAPLSVPNAVTAMRQGIDGLTAQHQGAFVQPDGSRFPTW